MLNLLRICIPVFILALLSCSAQHHTKHQSELTYEKEVGGIMVRITENKFFEKTDGETYICAPIITCSISNTDADTKNIVLKGIWHYGGEKDVIVSKGKKFSVGPKGSGLEHNLIGPVPVEGPGEGILVDVHVQIDSGSMTPVFQGVPIKPGI